MLTEQVVLSRSVRMSFYEKKMILKSFEKCCGQDQKAKGEIKTDELLSTTGAQNTNDVNHKCDQQKKNEIENRLMHFD